MSAPIKAIAFDAYGTLFDVYCMTTLAEVLFPDHGAALTTLWRDKQLNYSHIRTLSGRYKPFWEVTADALVYATTRLGLELTDEKKRRLMNQYACLDPFPENRETLVAIRDLGLPLAVLSNGNRSMLEIGLRFSGLADYFDHILSAEAVKKFKTAREVYALADQAFGLPPEEILFVSSNNWDVSAAGWFGYTTFWVNRDGQCAEVLESPPTARGPLLSDVLDFVRERQG